MARNASGVYSLPDPPVVSGTTIESADENTTRDDIAAEITNSLDRNGRGAMVAPLRLFTGSNINLPDLAWGDDLNTGIYKTGADAFALVSGGVAALSVAAAGITLGLALLGSVTLTGGTVTASTPLITATQTWNNAAVDFIGRATDITITNSGSGSLLDRIRVGGITAYSLSQGGNGYFSGDITVNGGDISTGTNIDLNFATSGGTQLSLIHTASATRHVTIAGSNGGNPTLSVTGGSLMVTSNIIFTDNTYDIGANGATRPRHGYFAGNVTSAGTVSAAAAIAGSGGFLAADSSQTIYYGFNTTNTKSANTSNRSRLQLSVRNNAGTDIPVFAVDAGLSTTTTGSENTAFAISAFMNGSQNNWLTFNGTSIPSVGLNAAGAAGSAGGGLNLTFVGGGTQYGISMHTINDTTHWLEFQNSANASIGSISDNGGGTVSYNAFVGSHDSQLGEGKREEILNGTVFETMDIPCDFGFEEEYLPKVRVCDIPGSRRAYGVFFAWDDPQGQTGTKDLKVAAIGQFNIRMAKGQPIQTGYVESAGGGCARFQAIQDHPTAETLGEVNAAFATKIFDDGSFLMPCKLMKG